MSHADVVAVPLLKLSGAKHDTIALMSINYPKSFMSVANNPCSIVVLFMKHGDFTLYIPGMYLYL